jgi:thioredoxin reductase
MITTAPGPRLLASAHRERWANGAAASFALPRRRGRQRETTQAGTPAGPACTVVLEETISGGQAGSSPMIRNYPGFPHGVSGRDLARRACEQAWTFGAHLVFSQRAVGLERRGSERVVRLAGGRRIAAKTVIVATGIAWRRLGVPRLEALVGSGVFYGAAAAEARAMEGRDVFVVGAGNSGGQTALHLARYARRVTMLVRGDSLARSMSEYLIREIEATGNITVPAHRDQRRSWNRSPGSPHAVRPAVRPAGTGPGDRAICADRR